MAINLPNAFAGDAKFNPLALLTKNRAAPAPFVPKERASEYGDRLQAKIDELSSKQSPETLPTFDIPAPTAPRRIGALAPSSAERFTEALGRGEYSVSPAPTAPVPAPSAPVTPEPAPLGGLVPTASAEGLTDEEIGRRIDAGEYDGLIRSLSKEGHSIESITEALRAELGSKPAPAPAEPPKEEGPGFLERLDVKAKERFGKAFDVAGSDQSRFSQVLQTGGQAAGFIGDIFGEALVSGYKMAGEPGKEKAKELLNTPAGTQAMKAISNGVEAWNGFKKEYPEFAGDLEAVVNIASVLPAYKGAQLTAKGAAEGAEMVGKGVAKGAKATAEAVSEGLETGVEKAAGKILGSGDGTKELFQATSPSYNLLAKSKDINKIKEKAKLADEAVVSEGFLPKDTSERVAAYQETRANLWKKVEEAREGSVGTFDASKLADEIDAKIDSLAIKGKIDPSLKADVDELRRKADFFRGLGEVDAKQLGTIRAQINAQTKWAPTKLFGDTYDSVMKGVASTVRKSEDALIGALEKDGTVNALLKRYGAVTEMLEDVVKQDIKALRKKGLGIEETFSRIEGLGDVAKGVVGLVTSPGKGLADIGGGAAKLALGKVAGKLRDTDYLIRNGYEKLAKSMGVKPGAKAAETVGNVAEPAARWPKVPKPLPKTSDVSKPAPTAPTVPLVEKVAKPGVKVPKTAPKTSAERPNRRRPGGTETTRRLTRGMEGQRPGKEVVTKQRLGERRQAREGAFQEGAEAGGLKTEKPKIVSENDAGGKMELSDGSYLKFSKEWGGDFPYLIVDMVEAKTKRSWAGTNLMEKIKEYAQRNGFKKIQLWAFPQDESISPEALRKFYESQWYKIVEESTFEGKPYYDMELNVDTANVAKKTAEKIAKSEIKIGQKIKNANWVWEIVKHKGGSIYEVKFDSGTKVMNLDVAKFETVSK